MIYIHVQLFGKYVFNIYLFSTKILKTVKMLFDHTFKNLSFPRLHSHCVKHLLRSSTKVEIASLDKDKTASRYK